jgi:hypothetical protein
MPKRSAMRKIATAVESIMIICSVAFVYGQTTSNVHQTATRSTCSNIVALSGAKVDCSNLTPAQKKALENIPSILRMTFENKDYLDAIMKKLDEISKTESLPPQIVSAPNGIAIGGGTVTNPTVNNFAAPQHIDRRLAWTGADRENMLELLRERPAKFELSSLVGDGDSGRFAEKLRDFLIDAGWTPIYNGKIQAFTWAGAPWSDAPRNGSVLISYNGPHVPASQVLVQVSTDKPEGRLMYVLNSAEIGNVLLQPNLDRTDGVIEIEVAPSPEVHDSEK